MGVYAWCSEHEWIGEDEMSDPRTCFCGKRVNQEPPRVPFAEMRERPVESAQWFRNLVRAR